MNNFAITISAVDRATATVRKVNNSISQLTRPVNQLARSTKALGREIGIDKMAKSLGNVARNAKVAAVQVSKIAAPITAIVGGGSIIGLAALANEWARVGSEVLRTSRTIGVGTSELQQLRGAAQVMGVSSEALTGGLQSLGDTLQDALYGRNQQALAVLNKLGVQIHRTSSGAVDSTRAFNDLSNAIANVKSPQVQALIARQFGLEAVLPLLREGPRAMAEYQRKVKALGAEMSAEQVKRAENLGVALNYLNIAGQGLRNTIGDALIPALQPLIEDLTKWISANRELIGAKVGRWAADFARWVKDIDFNKLLDGLGRAITSVGNFVDAIGGWKVAAIAVAGIMAGPLLLSITNIGLGLTNLAVTAVPVAVKSLALLGTALGGANASAGLLMASLRGIGALGALGFAGAAGWGIGTLINDQLQKRGISIGSKVYDWIHPDEADPKVSQTGSSRGVVDFFKSKGWTESQALGIAANLKKESGFNTDAVGDNGKAYGVAQWHGDRQAAFQRWAGKNIRQASLEEQLGFVNYELTQGNERKAGDALRGATNERDAASIISRQYERPANADGEAAGRADMASSMKQQLEIRLTGLPAGVKATAHRTDGSNVPVRVSSSMNTAMSP
ncbi:MAG: phage tail tape measure protein [Variovorax sp.]|nr:phage tail tape measure protein [Variovorax sp.]